jgi:hypothetical protein
MICMLLYFALCTLHKPRQVHSHPVKLSVRYTLNLKQEAATTGITANFCFRSFSTKKATTTSPTSIMIATAATALSLLTVAQGADAPSYHGHSVLRCSPTTASQMDELHEMNTNSDTLDFWKEPTKTIGGFVDIMVRSEERAELEHKMKLLGIPCKEMLEDVQDVINSQKKLTAKRSDVSYFESYHPPTEVFEYIENLVRNLATTFCYPLFFSFSHMNNTHNNYLF